MMSLWDALRMNMMISYQELVRTFPNKIANQPLYSNNAIEWYNGIYWHSEHYAVGYGLKYFRNMALMENHGGAGRTTGLGHYFNLTYKF